MHLQIPKHYQNAKRVIIVKCFLCVIFLTNGRKKKMMYNFTNLINIAHTCFEQIYSESA